MISGYFNWFLTFIMFKNPSNKISNIFRVVSWHHAEPVEHNIDSGLKYHCAPVMLLHIIIVIPSHICEPDPLLRIKSTTCCILNKHNNLLILDQLLSKCGFSRVFQNLAIGVEHIRNFIVHLIIFQYLGNIIINMHLNRTIISGTFLLGRYNMHFNSNIIRKLILINLLILLLFLLIVCHNQCSIWHFFLVKT